MTEERHTGHRRALMHHLKQAITRTSGGGANHERAEHASTQRRRRLVAVLALGIIAIGLHAAGIMVLVTTGLSGASLNNPLTYVLSGLLLSGVVVKLKHAWDVRHRKNTTADAEHGRKQ